MKEQYVYLFILLALIFGALTGGLFINQLNKAENSLYINRLYDKDRIIDMWEERALNQLKLIENYCDEFKDTYQYVQFDMKDCEIYQAKEGNTNVICERNKPLFVQTD